MKTEYTGWELPPIHMSENALALIESSNLSDAAKIHAANIVEKGYTVIPKTFSSAYCGDMVFHIKNFIDDNELIFKKYRNPKGVLPRFTNLHTFLPRLTHLFCDNNILLEVQDFFFGSKSSLYTSLYYEKGSQQPFHRDTPVFSTRPEYYYFGNTVYLENTNDENGCLEVIPGSHLVGELDREALALLFYENLDSILQLDNEIWIEYQRRVHIRAEGNGLVPCKVHCNAGDTLIWHPQLLHSGSPIRDLNLTRHSFVFHTVPSDTAVYHQHCFFNPSKAFPRFSPEKYVPFRDRRIMNHPQGIAFGDPINVNFTADQLNLSSVS